jgi:tetratricopeptide (TPR) repeat protein
MRKHYYKHVSNIIPGTLILIIALIVSYLLNQIKPSSFYTTILPVIVMVVFVIMLIDLLIKCFTTIEYSEEGLKKYFFKKPVLNISWDQIKYTNHQEVKFFHNLIYENLNLNSLDHSFKITSDLQTTAGITYKPGLTKDLSFVHEDGIRLLEQIKEKLNIDTVYTKMLARDFIDIVIFIMLIIIIFVNFVIVDYTKAGQYAYLEGNYRKAVEDLNKAIRHNPDDADLYFYLGNSYLGLRNYDKALESFQLASNLSPINSQYVFMLGKVYFKLNQYSLALDYFKKALDLNPTMVKVYYDMGKIYMLQNKNDEALIYFNKAIELGERNSDVYSDLARTYRLTGNDEKALESISKAIDYNPGDYLNYWELGKIYYNLKDYKQSIKALKQAEIINPNDSLLLADIAACYLHLNDIDLAISKMKEAMISSDNNYYLSYNLGYMYYLKKEYDLAAQFFSNINIELYTPTVYLYIFNDSKEKSLQKLNNVMEKLLEVKPDNPILAYIAANVNVKLKNNKKALHYYKKIKKIAPNLSEKLLLNVTYE